MRRLPKTTRLVHPLGIVIHPNVVLGERITIYQHVTIGTNRIYDASEKPDDLPVIEDDVVLCCHAMVLGRVRVGRGAVVGANAVVTKDVAPGTTVVGVNRIV